MLCQAVLRYDGPFSICPSSSRTLMNKHLNKPSTNKHKTTARREGELKIADFGLARNWHDQQGGKLTNRVITLWYRSVGCLCGGGGVSVVWWCGGVTHTLVGGWLVVCVCWGGVQSCGRNSGAQALTFRCVAVGLGQVYSCLLLTLVCVALMAVPPLPSPQPQHHNQKAS